MAFCLFLVFNHGGAPAARLSESDDVQVLGTLRRIPKLLRAHVYTPAAAHDPFLNDGAPPRLVVQLYFERIEDLEAASRADGPLAALAKLASLADCPLEWEALLVRAFPTPDPNIAGEPWCTYLVAYDGPAQDSNAWHQHYIAHHPPLMRQMPGVRELEIYTNVEAIGFLPGKRAHHLQRNKVGFDDAAALSAALNSPIREAMRKDYHTFPPFEGTVTHFPMATRKVLPAG